MNKIPIMILGIVICLMVFFSIFVFIRVRKNRLLKKKQDLEAFFQAIKKLSERHEELSSLLEDNLPRFSSKKKLSSAVREMQTEKTKLVEDLLGMPLLGKVSLKRIEVVYVTCKSCSIKNCKKCYFMKTSS